MSSKMKTNFKKSVTSLVCYIPNYLLTFICLIQANTVVSNTCNTAPRLLTAAAASAKTSMDGKLRIILPWKV
jgi:hypothetical protein